MKGLLHIVFFFSIILISCRQNNFLSKAESNKPEIEKAIKHFKGDSLKLDALYFLLENIASQNVELPVIKDGSNSKEIDFTTLPSDSYSNKVFFEYLCPGS